MNIVRSRLDVIDIFKFCGYVFLLLIPVYAIVSSIMDQFWLMVIVDILLIPVAFVHGLILLAGG